MATLSIRAFFLTFWLLVWSGTVSAFAEDGDFESAVKDQMAGDYEKAIAKYQELLRSQPRSDAIWYNLGTGYQAKGDLVNAQGAYEKALSLNPDNAAYAQALKNVRMLRAQPMLEDGLKKLNTQREDGSFDNEGAIESFKKALEIDDRPDIWYDLGVAYNRVRDYKRAAYAYKKACDTSGVEYGPTGDFLQPDGKLLKPVGDGI